MVHYQNPPTFKINLTFCYTFFIVVFCIILYLFNYFVLHFYYDCLCLFFICFSLSLLPLTLTLDRWAAFKFDRVDFERVPVKISTLLSCYLNLSVNWKLIYSEEGSGRRSWRDEEPIWSVEGWLRPCLQGTGESSAGTNGYR